MADKSEKMLAAIEIGSSKICCAVAEPIDRDHFKLVAYGDSPSAGVDRGAISDMNQLTNLVREVATATHRQYNNLDVVVSGLAGADFIQSENTNSMVICRHETISQGDIAKLISDFKQISLPSSMRYLDIYPQEYVIDRERRTRSPEGLAGSRLEALLHVVTVKTSICRDLKAALQKSGLTLDTDHLYFNPVAAAEAIIMPDEKKNGVMVIDIGAGLTSVCVFCNDAVRYSKIYQFGGDDLTREIAIATRLSTMDAEKIKKELGIVDFREGYDDNKQFKLTGFSGSGASGRTISSKSISAILDEKVKEMFQTIYKDLRNSREVRLMYSSGIVLTGGTAWLPGLDRVAQSVFSQAIPGRDLSVRIGYPFVLEKDSRYCNLGGITEEEMQSSQSYFARPEFSTLFGYLNAQNRAFWDQPESREKSNVLSGTLGWLKRFFVGNF